MDCHVCSKVLSRTDNVQRHIRSQHPSVNSANSHISNYSTTGYDRSSSSASNYNGDTVNLKIRAASSLLLAGPSCSGKTTWVLKMLDENILQEKPQRIVWCSPTLNQDIENFLRTRYPLQVYKEFPEEPDIQRNDFWVVDDLSSTLCKNVTFTNMFTRGVHHSHFNLAYLSQNLFHGGKEHRTQSLNAHYVVVFKNPRDSSQIQSLASQVYPQNPRVIKEIFAHASKEPYSALLMNFHQDTPNEQRFIGNYLHPHPILYDIQNHSFNIRYCVPRSFYEEYKPHNVQPMILPEFPLYLPQKQQQQQPMDSVELLSKTIRHKAKYLLHSLKNIDWTNNQELVRNDKVIDGSNKYDLLKYATEVKHSKFTMRHPPFGWKEFQQVIKDSNIPNTLLGNAILNESESEDGSDDSDEEEMLSNIPLLKKCRGYIQVLATAPRSTRVALLNKSPKDLYKCLKTIAKEIQNKHIPATPALKKQWKLLKNRNQKTLKKLAPLLSQAVVKYL